MNLYDFVNSTDTIQDFKIQEGSFVKKNVTFLLSDPAVYSNKKYKTVIIGVPDTIDGDSFVASKIIRENLYSLVSVSGNLDVLDLGNIKPGKTFRDTCYAICEVLLYFSSLDTLVLLIGGSSSFDQGSMLAFDRNSTPLNYIAIDSSINASNLKPPLATISKEVNPIYNYSNIGYQSYLVERHVLDTAEDNFFESYRLGLVRTNLKDMEPVLRDANHVSFNINAVRHSDAPAASRPSPNGLSGEEFCQLAFYTGHGIRLKSLGIYDFLPNNDIHSITAILAAQTIWYFLEGLSNVIYEEPDTTPENFMTYIIHHNETDSDISFHKSSLTNRWWMEISAKNKVSKVLLSCSQEDYNQACRQEVPERWWKTYHRLKF